MTNVKAGWEVLEETTFEEFPIFTIKKSRRLNPKDKQPIDFVRIDGLDWANVIALTPDNQVVLIRQYRHGSDEFTIEIPGGCVEKGEDPSVSAIRELEEETGYSTNDIEYLGTIRPNPALMSNRCFIYLARGATLKQKQNLDPAEDITVLLKPLAEVLEMVKRGEINHAMMVAGFGLYALKS